MSKWRPTENGCLYVIPDIQGAAGLLEKICTRILPLRKSDGIKDRLVILGDLVDRHVDSHKVIDSLIALKKKYGDQVIIIKGNHEHMFLSLMNLEKKNLTLQSLNHMHNMWLSNGGDATLIGYLERAGIKVEKAVETWRQDPVPTDISDLKDAVSPYDFPRHRIADIIPKEHKSFLQNDLVDYYQYEHYLFVHGGCDPTEPIEKQESEVLYWDRSLKQNVLKYINFGWPENIIWEKTIVTGHNGPTPIIHEKFMMLDCGSPRQLLVVELNSMEAYMAYPDKDRLVKYELKETVKKGGTFRRVE